MSNCPCEVCHHILNCRFGISVPSTFLGAFFGFHKDVSAYMMLLVITNYC